MPQQLPQHKSLMFSDFGIRLRRVTPSRGEAVPVSYSHQDDYYIIGLVDLFLSATFLTVTVTGIMLLAYVSGANSGIGLWHYRLGILLTVLSLVHAARRR